MDDNSKDILYTALGGISTAFFVGRILQDRCVIQIKDKHDEGDSFTI